MTSPYYKIPSTTVDPLHPDPEAAELEVFNVAKYLTFDQSLTNTGWAVYDAYTRKVEACGVLVAEIRDPHLKSFHLTFEKAKQLEAGLIRVLTDHSNNVDQILIEMPAVTGYRTESSLMAAEKIFTVCRHLDLAMPVLVSRQHACKVVVGKARCTKKETSDAVEARIVSHPPKSRWNEHIKDAVLLAVCEGLEGDSRPFTSYAPKDVA